MKEPKKQFVPSIFDGVILAITTMLGVAIGTKLNNIKMGISLGLLAGVIITCIVEFARYSSFKKQE